MAVSELSYDEVPALADKDAASAGREQGYADMQLAAAQLRVSLAAARSREAAAVCEFIGRHPSVTIAGLLGAAEAEVAEAESAAAAAHAEVEHAEAKAGEAREVLRDHKGHLRVLRRQQEG